MRRGGGTEPRLLRALLVSSATLCGAEWTGLLGLKFESDRDVEQRTMHCPQGFITGLHVRHGRDHRDDVDTYDFKLKCGSRWGSWSGMSFKGFKEEKAFECPMKMHMTGLEVKRGRREFGDIDTYDFKLQCSGVWQDYIGLGVKDQQQQASQECPAGTQAWAWKAYRGFVKKGDRDFYEFDLNCKAAEDARAAVRKMPSLRELGLPQNVFVWSAKDVGTWLDALGLGTHRAAFEANKLQGDVVFLLLESHLQDMGMYKIGDRLYFMEELTQLHDATKAWSKALNIQLASTRTLPNLQRSGLPSSVVSWSVKEVTKWIDALGLGEWVEAFRSHRVQGDVMFSLKEADLQEMGVTKIGDRLYLIDCLQSLYEELTSWQKKTATVDPTRMLGAGVSPQGGASVHAARTSQGGSGAGAAAGYAGAAAAYAGMAGAGAGAGYAGAGVGAGAGGGATSAANAIVKQLLSQGFSMQEVLQLVQTRPDLIQKLGLGGLGAR